MRSSTMGGHSLQGHVPHSSKPRMCTCRRPRAHSRSRTFRLSDCHSRVLRKSALTLSRLARNECWTKSSESRPSTLRKCEGARERVRPMACCSCLAQTTGCQYPLCQHVWDLILSWTILCLTMLDYAILYYIHRT